MVLVGLLSRLRFLIRIGTDLFSVVLLLLLDLFVVRYVSGIGHGAFLYWSGI